MYYAIVKHNFNPLLEFKRNLGDNDIYDDIQNEISATFTFKP